MSRKDPIASDFSLVRRTGVRPGLSPYRLVDHRGEEVAPVNGYLDFLATRGLSECTVRAYGFALLHFWGWLTRERLALDRLCATDMLQYIRRQLEAASGRAIQNTINQRLCAIYGLYHWHTSKEFPASGVAPATPFRQFYTNKEWGHGFLYSSRNSQPRFYIKAPGRVITPLSRSEVAAFFRSMRTWRDLSIAGLMLLCGLRSAEVVALLLADLQLSEAQVRVMGKGRKQRVLPLPPQILSLLETYLKVERPKDVGPHVFVCLKGAKRGSPMTLAGVRSLFRYHRTRSGVQRGNPHRLRHTFGTEMVQAGLSLPVLMRLMGHASIHTTMAYVEVSPSAVWDEFHRVVRALHDRGFGVIRSDGGNER